MPDPLPRNAPPTDRESRRERSRDRGDRDRREYSRDRDRRDRSRDRDYDRRDRHDRRDDRYRRDDRDRRRSPPREYRDRGYDRRGGYGGYGDRRRDDRGPRDDRGARESRPAAVLADPYAHLRAKAAAVNKLDPAERARQMKRAQLEARLELMKKQVRSEGGDFDSEEGIWKTLLGGIKQKEIYVGNLAIGQVQTVHLQELFNQSLAKAYPETAAPGCEAVTRINMHSEGKYAFVEFRTAEMATTSLFLDGVELMNSPLQIGRPSGWKDPHKTMEELKRAEEDLKLFDQGVDVEAYRREEAEKLRAAAEEKAADGQPVGEPSKAVVLDNMVSRQDLGDDNDYDDLQLDLKEESNSLSKGLGAVVRVVVPRPPASDLDEFFGRGHYGKAYVEFDSVEAAAKARKGMDNRTFDGRQVVAKFATAAALAEAAAA